jgi:hypothetical protein
MHELFELPKKTINREREERFLNKYRKPPSSVSELEKEVKGGGDVSTNMESG